MTLMPSADFIPTDPDQKPASEISSVRPDRILAIALGIVAVFGALEIAGVVVHYIRQSRERYAASHPTPPANAAATKTAPAPAQPNQPAPVSGQAPAESKPQPPTVASTAERLLREATELRDKGDTTSALARLQDASQKDPKNAEVLATMAMVYESIQLSERSNETWKKIQAIGPSAGPYYELADSKLKGGPSAPSGSTANATGPGLAGVAPLDAGVSHTDTNGIPDGATFGITDIQANDAPDADSETNMKLRIAVKVRPNTPIDHTKVKIQVFFYDTLDNKDVILTDADVSYEWITPHHDWKDTDTEVLMVTYLRPKKSIASDTALSVAAANVTPPVGKKKSSTKKEASTDAPAEEGHRKYLGYIVRIYYSDQLQSVRADPSKLLNLFPPPMTAPQ
jgi:hypothetical protein